MAPSGEFEGSLDVLNILLADQRFNDCWPIRRSLESKNNCEDDQPSRPGGERVEQFEPLSAHIARKCLSLIIPSDFAALPTMQAKYTPLQLRPQEL